MKTKEGVEMPARATKGSACYDFFAPADINLKAGEWTTFGTGVSLDGTERLILKAAPHHGVYIANWALMLYPRSGLGFKYKVRLANTVGIIDQDYRDEIQCSLCADEDVFIPEGKAYMQGMFVPFLCLEDEVAPTRDRDGGFGSTDKK